MRDEVVELARPDPDDAMAGSHWAAGACKRRVGLPEGRTKREEGILTTPLTIAQANRRSARFPDEFLGDLAASLRSEHKRV